MDTNQLFLHRHAAERVEAQRELVAKQVEDTTKLHVGSFIQKTHQRDVEKKAEMAKYLNPNIKR